MIPGGVSSPVRAMRSVGRDHPLFLARGEGGWVWDADGNRYVDWVMSWGPLIAGHAHPAVVEAVRETAGDGTTFGAPTEIEVELARAVVAAVPSVEQVRFVSSGTEAAMSALRLARAFTGRDRILKFAGGYHGHADALLAQAGSGLATLGIPSSPGVPDAVVADTLVAEYNDLEAVRRLAEHHGDQLAAVIVEPVAGNMGVVAPEPGFLEGLRTVCNGTGALLIADEVITGFRIAYGGGQERFAVRPDLTCLGKIVGGGLPAAAFGGRTDVMALLAPEGDVYQAGTLSGNPLAMAAGLATLRILQEPGAYDRLERTGAALEAALAGPGDHREPGRSDADGVPSPRPGAELRRRRRVRHHALRSVSRAHARPGHRAGAVAVRGGDALARPHRGAARDDRGRRGGVPRVSVLDTVAERAAEASPLWASALLPEPRGDLRFAESCPERHLLGVETIYEGYLLHHGTSRLFDQDDRDLAVLTGDYLYAAGLREICATGDLAAVDALAELIAACAARRGDRDPEPDDGLWDETVARLHAQ